MTEQEQSFIAGWAKTQNPSTSGLRPCDVHADGTRELRMVVVSSEPYPQQGRTGWKVKEEAKEDAPFTFFNIYPEDYHRIVDIERARNEGTEIPVVINADGKAVMLRVQDYDPTHPIAKERANLLAEGKIDKQGRKTD